ncbi:MAG: hypothetical protein JNL82_12830 [Myxococcales bacterium]|nr:hypothetical protein [Myxococcales bacterium]
MSEPAPVEPHRRGLALAALAVLAVHFACFAYFVPTAVWWTSEPIIGVDYETHVGQTWGVIAGLDGWGRSWVYDPTLLAGSPQGLIFDADNKGWELFTWALHRLGVAKGLAFNLFVVLAHWAVPAVMYASARLFALGRGQAVAVMAMGSLLWWFDSFAHWLWFVGMTAYGFAGYFCLLPLALFWRWLRDRRAWQALAAGATLALAHQIHPYSFTVLAVPLLLLYVTAARRLGWRGHAAVWAMVAATLAVNTWWLVPSLKYWHYILDSGYFGQAGPQFILADLFGLVLDTTTSGMIGTRSGLRTLVLVLAAIGLVLWRRERDPRLRVLATALAVLAALTYFGALVWLLAQIQPYRHVLPLGMFATIPAAVALTAGLRWWRETGRTTRVALAVVAVPAAQHLASDALYYMRASLPEVALMYSGARAPIASQGFPAQVDYRMRPRNEADMRVAEWVRTIDDGSRILIEEPMLGEQIAWRTDAQVLGGFTYRNLQHGFANLFRRRKMGVAGDDELRAYFETYGVGWVILTNQSPAWDRRKEVLEPVARFDGHRMYRTKIKPTLLAEGTGTVSVDTNLIRVTGSDPRRDLVLRFHWMETLVCAPDCEVRRVRVDTHDPVGFIKIPAPHPADLEVRNGY